MNGMEDALRQFLAANPDLPAGEEQAETAPAESARRHADKLQVVIERKGRAGKTATIIAGFTCSDEEVADLATRLKTRLGTGGSARGGEILLQGDRRKDVIDFMRANGYKI